jgi:hypothetical protein
LKNYMLLDAVLALSAALVGGRCGNDNGPANGLEPEDATGALGGGFDAARHSGSRSGPQLNRVAGHAASPDEDSRAEAEAVLTT